MRKLGALLALIVVGIVAYKFAYPSVAVRYRITTVTELDGKQSSSSSVMEVTYYKNIQLLGVVAQMQMGIRGEALQSSLETTVFWSCSWRGASIPARKISFHLRTV
jgi:hypothetical protein